MDSMRSIIVTPRGQLIKADLNDDDIANIVHERRKIAFTICPRLYKEGHYIAVYYSARAPPPANPIASRLAGTPINGMAVVLFYRPPPDLTGYLKRLLNYV